MRVVLGFLSLTLLLGLAAADAPVRGDAISNGVATTFIVKYKDNADLSTRVNFESTVNTRITSNNGIARRKRQARGVRQTYNMTKFNGYSVEIYPEDLNVITRSPLV
jgi:hypothetical protein